MTDSVLLKKFNETVLPRTLKLLNNPDILDVTLKIPMKEDIEKLTDFVVVHGMQVLTDPKKLDYKKATLPALDFKKNQVYGFVSKVVTDLITTKSCVIAVNKNNDIIGLTSLMDVNKKSKMDMKLNDDISLNVKHFFEWIQYSEDVKLKCIRKYVTDFKPKTVLIGGHLMTSKLDVYKNSGLSMILQQFVYYTVIKHKYKYLMGNPSSTATTSIPKNIKKFGGNSLWKYHVYNHDSSNFVFGDGVAMKDYIIKYIRKYKLNDEQIKDVYNAHFNTILIIEPSPVLFSNDKLHSQITDLQVMIYLHAQKKSKM